MYTIKSRYSDLLNKEVEKNCPEIFRHELRIPEFYIDAVKSKINKNQVKNKQIKKKIIKNQ